MTNEEFLRQVYMCLPNIKVYEHAKKLVAVAEAAKDVAANPHNNFDKILILRGKL